MTAVASRTRFLGVVLDPLGMEATVATIADRIARGEPGAHLGVNAANLVMAHDDPTYGALLAAADIVTADGQSVVWGGRLVGIKVPERVTGIDLMTALVAEARRRDWSIYLLGATADVVGRLAGQLAASGVQVAGFRDGFFAAGASSDIVTAIRATGAQLLFVGMPSPAKERLIIDHARPAGVPYSIGVGGSFDVLAGELRRAPRLVQRLGFEWLFRLAQEPGRLWRRYAVTNARFGAMLVADMRRRRRWRWGR
jgi:N-acetylglucosaminyldiphosphoundecaprenol N-acetyl-beta-D-mannosaminyltransferase